MLEKDNLSPITYHLSPITYHLSPITYHLSPITYTEGGGKNQI